MSAAKYSSEWVQSYYDNFGAQEWERLVRSPGREVQLAVHANAVRLFINPGDRVLEIGAGPGRFTQVLSEIGARVVVTDISQVQLDLNRANAEVQSFAGTVEEWRQVDMCDLSGFEAESFDVVLAFGGPLSYVLDRRELALAECIRVTRPGAVVLVGVMSLWGTVHQYLEGVLCYSPDDNARIIATGDLTAENAKFATHYCHMFRSDELRQFLEAGGLKVEFMSSSSGLSVGYGDELVAVRQDEVKWAELIRMEILACQAPGYLDSGTHLIAAGRKPA